MPIINDYGFVARLPSLPNLVDKRKYSFSYHILKTLIVEKVANLGIQIVPEISISSNAGGWHHSGMTVRCPVTLCNQGKDIPLDISDPLLLPVIMATIRDVLDIFSSSQFIHLGTDERNASLPCLKEAHVQKPDFDTFERKLETLLKMEGIIDTNNILRWQNKEPIQYPNRVGTITQCRPGNIECARRRQSTKQHNPSSWFATVSIADGGPWQIYNTTRQLALMKPIGIVADIPNLDKTYFDTYNISQRLLSFAMGTSSSDDVNIMDRPTFEKRYNEICTTRYAPRIDVDCIDFASSNESIHEIVPWETKEYKESNCNSKTVEANVTVYRDYIEPYYN